MINLLSSSWTIIVLAFWIPGLAYIHDNVKDRENYVAITNLLRVLLVISTGLMLYSLYLSFT